MGRVSSKYLGDVSRTVVKRDTGNTVLLVAPQGTGGDSRCPAELSGSDLKVNPDKMEYSHLQAVSLQRFSANRSQEIVGT